MKSFLNILTLLLASIAEFAFAAPNGQLIARKTPACDKIEMYSTQWFLDNALPNYRHKPIENKALFYTEGLSEFARTYAKADPDEKKHRITIWEIWPCNNYYIKVEESNPLRCIMSDEVQKLTYFENMSRAVALMSNGRDAQAIHRDLNKIPTDTIWGRIELEALKQKGNPGGQVDKVTAFQSQLGQGNDVDKGSEGQQLSIDEWVRLTSGGKEPIPLSGRSPQPDPAAAAAATMVKRASGFKYCFTKEQYAEMYAGFEDKW